MTRQKKKIAVDDESVNIFLNDSRDGYNKNLFGLSPLSSLLSFLTLAKFASLLGHVLG